MKRTAIALAVLGLTLAACSKTAPAENNASETLTANDAGLVDNAASADSNLLDANGVNSL